MKKDLLSILLITVSTYIIVFQVMPGIGNIVSTKRQIEKMDALDKAMITSHFGNTKRPSPCYATYDTADIMKRRAIMEKTRVFDPKAQPYLDLTVRTPIKCN